LGHISEIKNWGWGWEKGTGKLIACQNHLNDPGNKENPKGVVVMHAAGLQGKETSLRLARLVGGKLRKILTESGLPQRGGCVKK